MSGLRQQAEARRVVVEARQRQKQAGHEPCGSRRQRPELHLGIEFLLEAAVLDDHVGVR